MATHPTVRPPAPVRYTDLLSSLRLRPAEAVALALAAADACDITGGIPAAAHLVLHPDGRVSSTAPVQGDDATDGQRTTAIARLVEELLALDGERGTTASRPQVPGGLLVLLARALGRIDLAPPSSAALRHGLSRFGSAEDAAALPHTYARWAATTKAAFPPTAAPRSDERAVPVSRSPVRRSDEWWDDLVLRPPHSEERELFEAFRPRADSPAGLRASTAVALWISAAAAGFLVMYGVNEVRSGGTHALQRRVAALDPFDAGAKVLERLAPADRVSPPAVERAAGPRLLQGADGGDLFSPSFGPDGRELLFHRGRERAALMRAAVDESGVRTVTTLLADGAANYHAALSPDGQRLAYDSDRDGVRSVYVSRADGTGAVNVSGTGYAAVPRWSPDGRRIAFIRSEPSQPRVWNVWIAELDTGRVSRVSRHTAGQAWSASWFPDGGTVAYTVEDRLVIVDLVSGRTRVARSPVRHAMLRTPAVSPDGRAIAVQVYGDGVWLFDVAGGTMRRLAADRTAEEFTWSPDGRRLVYHSRRGGRWAIWELRLAASA